MDAPFLYQEICAKLAEEIRSGKRVPGDRVETERELAEKHNVSRITSKRALNLLEEEGLVVRRRGLGTFVVNPADKGEKPLIHRPSFSLKENTCKRLGLIMEDLGETYALSLFYEIDRQAAQAGFQLCLSVSYGDQKNERSALHQLLALNVQGIIIMPAHGRYYNSDLLRLVLDHFPVVIIDRPLAGIPAPCVYTDNLKASSALTELLVQKGHQSIGFFTPATYEAISLEERHMGYVQVMKSHGLHELEPLVLPVANRLGMFGEGPRDDIKQQEAIHKWLEKNPSVSAVIGTEYGIAEWTRIAAGELKKSIPKDLAICCFDEKYGFLGDYFYTHMRQNGPAIALKAMELMLDMLEGKDVRRQTHLIPATCLIGETT
jgi:GntR family transcriptional regulator, arabinose operon transcriptional repressor